MPPKYRNFDVWNSAASELTPFADKDQIWHAQGGLVFFHAKF